jgi:hypothetical protein
MNQQEKPESEKTDVVDMSDADIERLLGDAYAVPSVPKTLLKRLDRAVSEQWGDSPSVVRKEPNRLTRVARSWKTWPVAASLTLALVLALVFRSDAHAYSWAAVVEALAKQPVVQLGVAGSAVSETSWLSISEKKLSYRSENAERLYDLAQGLVLERGTADSQVKRFKLSDVAGASDRDRIALSFLSGSLAVEADALRLSDLRLTGESWKLIGDTVELKVTFGTGNVPDDLKLTLIVDAETHLPQRCVVSNRDGKVREEVLTYPRTQAEQLVAQAFPANLPIVDVASIAAVAESSALATSAGQVGTDAKQPTTATTGRLPGVGVDKNRQAIPLTGAASLGWSPIKASRLSNDEVVAEVNTLLERLWHENKVTPAGPASDAELMRRVYLDLAGRAPTVTEVRNYLNDSSPDRYAKLVDQLLASPDHATHLATVWRTFLLPEGVDLARFGGIPAFDGWLSGRFGKNVPYDQLVRELLLAEGRLAQSGPLLFYSAAKLDADQLAGRTARVFLGMRLDCAQCHDDPFEPWTQQDFWSYAAFFARISRPQAALESVSTVMRVRDIDRGEVMMPNSKDPVAPKFPDGSNLDESPAAAARRQQLARWLTGPDNPYFARAAVNRVWAHMFGRGIVDPVDGFGKRNPPRSTQLLDLLAAQLLANDFNLREAFRAIALTRAYQLSSGTETGDPVRQEWFAQMNIKMLTAEQIYDCITVASMLIATESNGFSIARVGNASRDEFLQQFKTLAGRPIEYQGGIPQALTLMNGTLINSATDLARSGLLKSLEAPFFTDDQRIEVIYLATLSRQPTSSEWKLLRSYMNDRDPNTSIQEPLADILWALLNGAEFTMNH